MPTILAGVPIEVRQISLLLDRPGLIRNPTDCTETDIRGAAVSIGGALANISDRFQVGDCDTLPFRPALAVRFSNPARNAHPRIDVELRPRAADANLAAANFTLPAGELLDLRRVRALCDRGLPPESCPPRSRLGSVVLVSPLLRGPLAGPIYLRRAGAHLPDIVTEVQGEGLRFVLRGHTATRGGRLRVRFPALPDIPLSKARFTFAGGRHGVFVNSASLCETGARAGANLGAHNGKQRQLAKKLRLRGDC